MHPFEIDKITAEVVNLLASKNITVINSYEVLEKAKELIIQKTVIKKIDIND